jgi:hypothetical protein
MGATFLRGLQQPEYIHVLINPFPIYGLGMGVIALVVALLFRSRPAQMIALILILISAASAWPVAYYGHAAYDRVLSMSDADGRAWLQNHEDRAEDLIWIFYALAVAALAAIIFPQWFPKAALPLTWVTLLFAIASLGAASYIGYAGGKIRHREFRNAPPPPVRQHADQD